MVKVRCLQVIILFTVAMEASIRHDPEVEKKLDQKIAEMRARNQRILDRQKVRGLCFTHTNFLVH